MLNKFKKIVIGDNAHKFEECVFLFISFMSGLVSLIFVIPLNLIQKYPLIHSLFVIVFILFSFIFWSIARFKRIFFMFSFVLTVNISLSFIYIYNAGIKGSIPYFLCQIFLFTIILLRGNKRRVMVLIQIISLMILFSIDIIKPEWIIQYPDEMQNYFDHITSIGLVFLISAILIWQLVATFDIERRSIKEELAVESKKAVIDSLTGLFNRRYLDDFIKHLKNRLEYSSFSYSVIMGDIDLFKQINDTYGHQAGDQVLTKVSEIMQLQLRKTDVVGRYGGEEFLFILPETQVLNALLLAEKIRKSIMEFRWDLIIPDLQVTMSFGIAGYSHITDGIITKKFMPHELICKADSDLYIAKENGRNQSFLSVS